MDSLINSKKKDIISRFETRLDALFKKCETPIEKLFLSYFYHYFDTLYFSKIDFLFGEVVQINEGKEDAYFGEDCDFQELSCFLKITGIQIIDTDIEDETKIHVYPQYKVKVDDKKEFRLDFLSLGVCPQRRLSSHGACPHTPILGEQ